MKHYIRGDFQEAKSIDSEWTLASPADLNDELGVVQCDYAMISEAVAASCEAFHLWKKTPLSYRIDLLKKFQNEVKAREVDFIRALGREVGKPEWEAKTEFAAVLGKIDITINESLKLTDDFQRQSIMDATDGWCRYRPHGVMVVVGPFNFPAHLPNGHWVPALLTGNTVIFKPSEKTPLIAQILAECFHGAGFPVGVFQMILGDREASRRLCVHPDVDGILFTGSYEVGLRIKQDTLLQHWKILALEMGGKNASIVWSDADLEAAANEVVFSAFVTAGQRCSSTSRLIVHHSIFESFLKLIMKKAQALAISHPSDKPFCGPLIDDASVDRYLKVTGAAVKEGYEPLIAAQALKTPWRGYYVQPSIFKAPDHSVVFAERSYYQQTEMFAPNLCVLETHEEAHAVALANATQYGLIASVYTRSRDRYLAMAEDLDVGAVNWNRSTAGASSRLPFGGTKKSGNHFPTALPATLYCAYPQSALEVQDTTRLKSNLIFREET